MKFETRLWIHVLWLLTDNVVRLTDKDGTTALLAEFVDFGKVQQGSILISTDL